MKPNGNRAEEFSKAGHRHDLSVQPILDEHRQLSFENYLLQPRILIELANRKKADKRPIIMVMGVMRIFRLVGAGPTIETSASRY